MGALANQSFVKMNGIGNEIVVVDLRKVAAKINKAVGYDLDPRKVEGQVLEVSYV